MPFRLHQSRESIPASGAILRDIVQFTMLIVLLCWLFARSSDQLGYNWQWYRIWHYLIHFDDSGAHIGPLLAGLGITLKISAISMVFSLLIGLITAILRLSRAPLARLTARIYLELTRNTPLLIQIFFIYFVLGPILSLERFTAAVLALGLFEGAYISEIFRAGILAVDKGQKEAGDSLGLSPFRNYRHVILPQAFRVSLPPLTNQMISLIKDSALVSTIAIYDLTMQAQSIIAETFLTFEIWFSVTIIYLLFTISLSLLAACLEKRVDYTR